MNKAIVVNNPGNGATSCINACNRSAVTSLYVGGCLVVPVRNTKTELMNVNKFLSLTKINFK
ncbi:hypothetical protein D3C86_1353690 [compost metagenome]